MYCILITDVTAVINDLTASNFDTNVFFHYPRLPGFICINSGSKLLDVFTDARSSQFGQKGMHASIQFVNSMHTHEYLQ